jgi:hypothetical protein
MDWFEVVDRALKELVLAPENHIMPVAYYISSLVNSAVDFEEWHSWTMFN